MDSLFEILIPVLLAVASGIGSAYVMLVRSTDNLKLQTSQLERRLTTVEDSKTEETLARIETKIEYLQTELHDVRQTLKSKL